jgi:hypothetical protein
VVSFGCDKVVGDNVLTHSHNSILIARTIVSMVKTTIVGGNTMEDINDLDIEFQPFDIPPSFVFINSFGSLFEEDTPS